MKRMAATILALAFSGAAFAQMHGHGMGGGGMSGGMSGDMKPMERDRPMRGMEKEQGGMQMGQPSGAMADGEVRKVDREAGKVTLRHGPMASLDMPAMTMVYGVKDAAVLDHLSAGDKVKFAAEKTDAGYTVTHIERAK